MNWRAVLAPALAATAGLALLAAHPPVGWWPATFLAPALLVTALWVDAARPTVSGPRALRLGALFGATVFAPMLSWLIMPAGVIGWALLVAVQVAWSAVLAGLIRLALDRWWLPLFVAVVWTGVDAWRGDVPLSGFEWGAISYAHTEASWLLPVARLLGGGGVTFLVVLIGVAAATSIRVTTVTVRDRGGDSVEAVLGGVRTPLVLLVGGLLVSVLATVEPPGRDGELDVLAVQGNDVRHWQDDVDIDDTSLHITTALHDETLRAIERDGPPDLTVWPESSIDRDPSSPRGRRLGELAGQAAAASGTLLAGVTLDGPDPSQNRYVAASLYRDGFDEVDRYVKRRLVPFGEYVPARAALQWIPALEQVPRDAIAGAGPQVIDVAEGVRAAVIICFETMFSDVVRSNLLAGASPAGVIITVTNDASFGESAEPAQHLAQSRLRAVETGRWVVHAAISGASAFVSPDGVVHDETDLFTVDSIRRTIPLASGSTPFLVVGDVVGLASRVGAAAAAVWAVLAARRRRRGPTGTSRAV